MPALDYLRRSGIDVSSKPDFDCVNFAQKRNFLDEDRQYDAVFIAHVPNGRNLSWTRMEFQTYSTQTDVSNPTNLANTIDSKNSSDRWAQRITQSSAKAVLSVGSYIEVEQNYLSASDHFNSYSTLITPINDASLITAGPILECNAIEKIYGENLDIPYQWLGISLHNNFRRQLTLSNKTDLSRRFSL